jgi:lipopolysaccharide/colanic/teichoic acid biosynthesis glycosyltransferase
MDFFFEVCLMQQVSGLQDRARTVSSVPQILASVDSAETTLALNVDYPLASIWSASPTRRFFDVAVALLMLMLFALPMLAIATLIRMSSRGPALFVQSRVGRWGKPFLIYKFRSMVFSRGPSSGPTHTREGDSRITPIGRVLRRFKLDELPQFYNVFRGDMSLVGPRPMLPQHTAICNMPFRPGITGAATLAFRREEKVLDYIQPALLDAFYDLHIRPMRASIDLNYMAHATFRSDMHIGARTALACIVPSWDRYVPLTSGGREESNLDLSPVPYSSKDPTCEEL